MYLHMSTGLWASIWGGNVTGWRGRSFTSWLKRKSEEQVPEELRKAGPSLVSAASLGGPTGGWCLPVGRRVKRPPGPGHPQELCCWAGPCTSCLQVPSALTGPAEARPCPPHGPQPHSDSGARPPQHQAATRGQTSTGGVGRSWSKGAKLQLCEQSKSAVRNTASNAGDVLDFRTPATEMVTVLTISLLMCASDHHAWHLKYTCLLKN